MKVIMLSGPSRTGKTTVINEVHRLLVGHYFTGNRHEDFETTITHNGLTIAFVSAGDLARETKNAFQKYSALGCDILICATTKDLLRHYEQYKDLQM